MELDEAGRFVEEVRAAVARLEFPVSGRHTLSAGITQATPRDTADSFTGRVDKGLYQAKDGGRNRSAIISRL